MLVLKLAMLNLRAAVQRPTLLCVAILGIAGFAATTLSLWSMADGLFDIVAKSGSKDRAIILSAGSDSEVGSNLPPNLAYAILDAPGIKTDSAGRPIVSTDSVLFVDLKKKQDGASISATLRGVSHKGYELRPEFKITKGRMYESGLTELVVGEAATNLYSDLAVGNTIKIGKIGWKIVGHFSLKGDNREAELLGDFNTIRSAFNRVRFQSITVRLKSHDGFDTLSDYLKSDSSLSIKVMRESDYFSSQAKSSSALVYWGVYVVGAIMALGAFVAFLNSTYATIYSRVKEFATLLAIGFERRSIFIAFFIEAGLFGVIGAVIGCFAGWWAVDGVWMSTSLGSQGVQQVFSPNIDVQKIVVIILFSYLISVVSSLISLFVIFKHSIPDILKGNI